MVAKTGRRIQISASFCNFVLYAFLWLCPDVASAGLLCLRSKPYSSARSSFQALNKEMKAAGAVVFVGGLAPARAAKSVRVQRGKLVTTDGPYTEAKEHIGGFWVLEAANMEEALEWGRKAVVACRAPVEVRQFH